MKKKYTYLKYRLKDAGYSQEDVGKALNITAETVSSKLNGRTDWRLPELDTIFEKLLHENDSEERLKMMLLFKPKIANTKSQ